MSIEDDLKNTKGDYIHASFKSALSSIPVLGGLVSELFGTVVTAPAEKRKENILIMLDTRLNEISQKVETFDVDKLSENELFLSNVLQATQIALRTHQNDKIAALLNAVSNTSLEIPIDDSLQQMFLNFIDAFNEWHLRLLIFLDDPKNNLVAAGLTTDFYMGGVGQVIEQYYPSLETNMEFTRQVINELHQRGLLNSDAGMLNTTMTGSGMVASRTSVLGKKFIEFISVPNAIK